MGDVGDRLRRLPESRLRTRAAAARELAQLLADAAAGIEGRSGDRPPAARRVPELNLFAVGDQVTVTGTDAGTAAGGLDGATPVWHDGERRALAEVLSTLQTAVQGLRVSL